MYGLLSRYSSRREDSVCSQACVMCVYAWGGADMPVCVFLQTTSGDSSLTTIISDLQSAQPAKAQGRLWAQTFSTFFLFFIILFFFSCPLILTHYSIALFHPVLSPLPLVSFILSHYLLCISPTSPKPNPVHLSPCVFYQLIHSFCSLSAGLV